MPLFDTWIDAYKIYKEVRQFRKGLVPQGKATSAPSIVYDTPSTSMMGYSPGRSPRVLAQYGYVGNPVVYRAINIIADECGSIPLKVKTKGGTGKILENSPLLFLLSQPNLDKSKAAYIQQMVSYWLIAGTSYTYLATGRTPQPQALYQLRPDLVEVMATEQGITEYKYTTGRTVTHYTPEEVRPLRFFHPLDELYGLSPITVASIVIDRQNEGEQWNASFMKHAARPSGAFTMQGMLGEEEYQRLKSEIMQKYVGKNNAGTPLLLEGGLQYVQTGNSPLDADWNASDANAGRKIAMAIGVDPLLLNDKEHSTYNNIREARIALADTTVHPMMTHIIDEWNGWLAPRYGTDIEIFMDERYFDRMRDDINATSVRMQNEFTKGIMSFNTAQMLAGREATSWGDFYQMGPQTYVQSKDMQEFLDQQHERRMAPPVLAPPGAPLLPDGGKPPLQLLPGGKKPPAPKDKVANSSKAATGWAMLMPTKVTEIAPARQTYAEQIEAMRSAWDTRFQAAMEMHFADEHSTIQQALVGVKTLQQAHSVIDSVLSSTVNNLASIFLKFYTNIGEDASRFVSEPLHVKSTLYRKSALSDLSQYAAQHIIGIDATTRNTVEEVFTQAYQQKSTMEDLQGYLDQVYTQFPTTRGINIARTEVTASSNLGMYLTACDIASTHGITMEKTWVAIDDEYTRDTHGEAGNETIDLLEYFLLDGSEMLFPGDTSRDARPKERINCRCCCQYTVSLKFNGRHDRHGRFAPGNNAAMVAIAAGQGTLFPEAVGSLRPWITQKPKSSEIVLASDIPTGKLRNAVLTHFDAGYEGDNPRYTTTVDGTKYFVKHMEGNMTGNDPQDMMSKNISANESFVVAGLARNSVPMTTFLHKDGEQYTVMPFAKGFKSTLNDGLGGPLAHISNSIASKFIGLEAILGTGDRHDGQYLYNPSAKGDLKLKLIDFDIGYPGHAGVGGTSALMDSFDSNNGRLDTNALRAVAKHGAKYQNIAADNGVYDDYVAQRAQAVNDYANAVDAGHVANSASDLANYLDNGGMAGSGGYDSNAYSNPPSSAPNPGYNTGGTGW